MPVTPIPPPDETFRVPRNGVGSRGKSSRMNRDNCPLAGTETVTGGTGCEPSIPKTSRVTKFGALDEFAMATPDSIEPGPKAGLTSTYILNADPDGRAETPASETVMPLVFSEKIANAFAATSTSLLGVIRTQP